MCTQTCQLELMKFNSSVSRWVFFRKWVKLTQDELFSTFKSWQFLRVYLIFFYMYIIIILSFLNTFYESSSSRSTKSSENQNKNICTLKKCSLLNIENNSSWVNFTHFGEKTHLVPLKLIFLSSSSRVYMYVKFDI